MLKHLLIVSVVGGTALADPQADARQQAIEEARKAGILGTKVNETVTALAKVMTGTWKCDGTLALPDKPTMKLKATLKTALDLDGFWLHESMTVDLGWRTMKVEAYMTADAGGWRRVALDSMGGESHGTSPGMKDQKMEWAVESTDGTQEHVHLDASDLKKGLHVSAERSLDKGKTWSPGPDMLCKH